MSPDEVLLAAANAAGTVYIWDWRKGRLAKTIQFEGREHFIFNSLYFTNADTLLLVLDRESPSGYDDAIFFNLADGKQVRETMRGKTASSFGRGIVGLAMGSAGFNLFKPTGAYADKDIKFEVGISDAVFSEKAKLIAGHGQTDMDYFEYNYYGDIVLLDKNGKFQRAFDIGNSYNDLLFSPDGTLIASLKQENGSPKSEFVPETNGFDFWDIESGRKRHRLYGHELYVNGGAFAPDGDEFLTWSGDGTLMSWDLRNDSMIHCLRGHRYGVTDALFLDGGGIVASAGTDGSVRIWSAETGDELASFYASGEGETAAYLTVKPDGSFAEDGGFSRPLLKGEKAPGGIELTAEDFLQESAAKFIEERHETILSPEEKARLKVGKTIDVVEESQKRFRQKRSLPTLLSK